jgi:hypothetical protein
MHWLARPNPMLTANVARIEIRHLGYGLLRRFDGQPGKAQLTFISFWPAQVSLMRVK